MAKKLRIGILGSGWIAEKMAITLAGLNDCEAYAIASRTQEKADAFAKRWGFEKAYGSYEALVKDEKVDLVYIATPHSHHYANTRLALENGKACLVEKAFTANAREAEELLSLAKSKNLFITEAIWTRYQPIRATIQEIIDSGIIGRPRLVTASLGYPMEFKERIVKPELCGGALLDLGVYSINFVRMFFGGDWKHMQTQCVKNATGMDMHDSISVIYENGMMANMQASACCVNAKLGIINGEKGYIIVDNVNNPQKVDVYNADSELVATHSAPEQITGYEYQVLACKEALEHGWLESPYMPHEETLEVMRIMDRCRREWGVKYPMDDMEPDYYFN